MSMGDTTVGGALDMAFTFAIIAFAAFFLYVVYRIVQLGRRRRAEKGALTRTRSRSSGAPLFVA
jgi:uncharacterized membrane protein